MSRYPTWNPNPYPTGGDRPMTESKRRTLPIVTAAAAAALVLPLAALVLVQPAPAAAQAVPSGRLAAETARTYRELARYPSHCRALAADAVDPVRAKRVSHPHSLTTSPDGPALTVWAGEVGFVAPEPVDLFVYLQDRPWVGPDKVSVTGEVLTEEGEVVGTVVYRDDGRAPDERTHDNVYSARFEVPPAFVPELARSFMVRVTTEGETGETAGATSGFLYSNPTAFLTGEYRDEVVDGSLVVSARVEVTEPGRYHLQGTLTTLSGEPVGWAQAAVELEPGTHWIDLGYYGLIFHERGSGGPFRLASLALATTTGMPNALNALVEDAHVVRPRPLASFESRPFGDPMLLESADRLENEAFFSSLSGGE